jgi:hypothetical protein
MQLHVQRSTCTDVFKLLSPVYHGRSDGQRALEGSALILALLLRPERTLKVSRDAIRVDTHKNIYNRMP